MVVSGHIEDGGGNVRVCARARVARAHARREEKVIRVLYIRI